MFIAYNIDIYTYFAGPILAKLHSIPSRDMMAWKFREVKLRALTEILSVLIRGD